MPEKLDYAMRETIPGGASIRPAMFFALAPLIVGLLTLSLWAATGWRWVALLGLLNIPFGMICFIAAIIAALRYARTHARLRMLSPSHVYLWCGLAIFTALLNFLACFGGFQAAMWLSNRYTLTIRNDGTTPITSCTLGPAQGSVALGPIPPGGRISHSWTFREGSVTCQAVIGNQTVSADVDGYVTGTMGPIRKTVRFNGTAPPTVK